MCIKCSFSFPPLGKPPLFSPECTFIWLVFKCTASFGLSPCNGTQNCGGQTPELSPTVRDRRIWRYLHMLFSHCSGHSETHTLCTTVVSLLFPLLLLLVWHSLSVDRFSVLEQLEQTESGRRRIRSSRLAPLVFRLIRFATIVSLSCLEK